MRKLFQILSISLSRSSIFFILFLVACGGGNSSENPDQELNPSSVSSSTSVPGGSLSSSTSANLAEEQRRYNQLIKEIIQPVANASVYEITFGQVKTLTEYQENNKVKCFERWCFDKNSYPDDQELWEEKYPRNSQAWVPWEEFISDQSLAYERPFRVTSNWVNISETKSIIIPMKIRLETSFKQNMLQILEDLSSDKNALSYGHLFPTCPTTSPQCTTIGIEDKIANCLLLNVCPVVHSIWRNRVYGESFIISYVDRTNKINYFYLTDLAQMIWGNDPWLDNMVLEGYTTYKNNFHSMRINLKDGSNNILKSLDFNVGRPLSRFRRTCAPSSFPEMVKHIEGEGFIALNKSSHTYRHVDQVIHVMHIPSLITQQADRGGGGGNCTEGTPWAMNNIPFYSKVTILDELDYYIVLETDYDLNNISSISIEAEFIYLEDWD